MISLGTRYWHFFLAQSVCVGVSGGAVFTACIATAASWFQKRRGAAYGVMLSGAGIGGTVVPIMLTRLVGAVGFAWAVRAVAFLYLGLLPVTVATVRSRLAPARRPFAWRGYLHGFRDPAYVCIVVASYMFYWGMFIPLNYIVLQAKAQGLSQELAPYLLPIINAFRQVWSLLSAHLIWDLFDLTRPLLVYSAALALASWLTSWGDSTQSLFLRVSQPSSRWLFGSQANPKLPSLHLLCSLASPPVPSSVSLRP